MTTSYKLDLNLDYIPEDVAWRKTIVILVLIKYYRKRFISTCTLSESSQL